MSKGESKEYRTRLKEITSVLHKYGITRGITPQKLRMILEDLGPTYINQRANTRSMNGKGEL